jgi:hypothetical protein
MRVFAHETFDPSRRAFAPCRAGFAMSAHDQAPELERDLPAAEVLLFGSAFSAALEQAGAAGTGLLPIAQRAIAFSGSYRLRYRWTTKDYTNLRNAAWAARNARVGADQNPLALRLVLAEAEALVAKGEPLLDVLEAFAELLMKP